MSSIIYYVAVSVDGFIADTQGSVGWLTPFEQSGEDYGYEALYGRLGAVVMGSATYEQVLAFGTWPYANVEAVVMTTQSLPQPDGGNVRFCTDEPADLARSLKGSHEKDIWLIGGGKLAAAFAAQNLIDEYDLAIMPLLLGAGIPLLAPRADGSREQPLLLLEHQVFPSGVIRARYAVRRTGKS